MGLIHPGDLKRARVTAVMAMDTRCDILSKSGNKVLNNAGGVSAAKDAWQPVAGGPFKCNLWRQRDFAVQAQEAGTQQQIARFKLSLPYGTAIATKQRVHIVGGSLYEVVGVDRDRADAIQVLCDLKLVT